MVNQLYAHAFFFNKYANGSMSNELKSGEQYLNDILHLQRLWSVQPADHQFRHVKKLKWQTVCETDVLFQVLYQKHLKLFSPKGLLTIDKNQQYFVKKKNVIV